MALHRDARAPVNLTPIAGLERHLHRLQGDARLALRAVREAVLERNREGRTSMIRGATVDATPAGRRVVRCSVCPRLPGAADR